MYCRKKWSALLLVLLAAIVAGIPAWSQDSASGSSAGSKEPAATQATGADDATASASSQDSASASQNSPSDVSPPVQETVTTPAGNSDAEVQHHGFDPAATVAKPLWGISHLLGDFNPIGKHVSAPLEAKFPGLRVKGFLDNVSQINTTATNHNYGVTGRDKDWRLQKQEERVKLEIKYQATEHLEFVSVNHFQWDGAYSMQDSKGLVLNGSPNEEYYTQGKRIFREAYLSGNYGKFNFVVGRQVINWGKLDGKVIDIINADDSRDSVGYHQGDYEWRYIGQFMTQVSFRPRDKTNIVMVWNPDFQPNVGAEAGSPYSLANYTPGTPAARYVRPSGFSSIGESEGGIRVDNSFGPVTFSPIYYYGYDRNPDPVAYNGAYHFSRESKFGYALDYATNKLFHRRFVFRSEGLYTEGKPYASSSSRAINGMVTKNPYVFGFAAETSVGEDKNKVDLMYEALWYHTPGVDGARTRHDIIHVFDVAHSFRSTSDRLNVDATFYVSKGGSSYGGWAGVYSVGWRFNDYVTASLGYNDYQGGSAADIASAAPFGAFRPYRNVQIGMKYEF